ncbi:hypothetical protein BDY19DRAFT_972570 [Irpex rosettiformis]|uniref:Uncharacterized protein n=1 Tax=Irpex rosettiformis TaxID=378272 RepID=A0ACB8TQM9_9APHY|nr:hypothetical protein BDY19DRAFT_972570 [Irpex rosettiformis]
MQEVGPWSRHQGTYKCAPASALSAYTFNGTVAVFHEHERQIKYWLDQRPIADYSEQVSDDDRVVILRPRDPKRFCLTGTQIASVGCDVGSQVTVFYQDVEGYLCYRNIGGLVWDEPVALCKALEGTGIAAVRWNTGNNPEIRVYYQDESYNIYERACSRGIWSANPTLIGDDMDRRTTISAVHWVCDEMSGDEIRVYYQEGPSTIQEKGWTSGKGWCWASILFDVFVAEFNVHVFTRGVLQYPVLNLWIASKEGQVLLRRAYNFKEAWVPAIGHSLPLTGTPY